MKTLFDIDGPAMRFITKLAYSAYLNILWFVCCLPIFTIGASTTALFYVSLKIAKDEESHLTKAFFHSFKENFRQSTIIWLILLAAGLILGIDGYVFYHMRFDSVLWALGTAVFIVLLAAYAIILMYIFPLLARFENTVWAMFKNALMIGMRFLFCTALMALVYFIMAVVVVRFFTPAIIFGEGLCAILCSYLLSNILLLCEEKAERNKDETVSTVSEACEAGNLPGIEESLSAEKILDTEDSLGTKESLDTERTSGTKERKWSVKDVHGVEKIGYIWEYYKLPIVIICIFLYITGYLVYGSLTHKDTILYTAFVNVSAGEALTEELSTDFLNYLDANTKKEEVEIYNELYLTEDASDADHEYAYASNTKLTAAITGKLLDVVLMDKTAFDILSKNGYLCNIEQFLIREAPDLYEKLQTKLVTNTVILEDNAMDAQLDSSVTYTSVTEEYPMAVDLSQSDLISNAGIDGTLYLGIISNSPRTDTAIAYLRYLMEPLP